MKKNGSSVQFLAYMVKLKNQIHVFWNKWFTKNAQKEYNSLNQSLFTMEDNKTIYKVSKQNGPVCGTVEVPGSKSMTNRALLLAALSEKPSILRGVLFSDDSRYFLECLKSLGYQLEISEEDKCVRIQGTGGVIPKKTGTIYVGSAGTAARFLTAMLALSDGEYTIQCSEQMKKRPMKPLMDALTELGAHFEYLEKEGFLPVKVIGNHGMCKDVYMDISKSTQFLSAFLMVAPITQNGMKITITSEKKDGAYIQITRKMLDEFHVITTFDGEHYTVPGKQSIVVGDYTVEPDVSAACYFFALAALTGGTITVKNVFYSSMQGDMKFLQVLKQLGCQVTETTVGMQVTGPCGGRYQGIDVDMNDFSDQTLTLAALAAYAESPTMIRNVGHIRGQECNRMAAIVNELNRVGVSCIEEGDNLKIMPGIVHGAAIETYDDHRVAMALSLLGIRTDGIRIINPECCSKTFENYFEVLEEILEKKIYK